MINQEIIQVIIIKIVMIRDYEGNYKFKFIEFLCKICLFYFSYFLILLFYILIYFVLLHPTLFIIYKIYSIYK